MIVLLGASSSGKDTLLKKLVEKGYVVPIVSTTDRPMRNGEVNGREYHFITREQTLEKIKNDEFIENRVYHPQNGEIWTYGITKDSFDINSDNTYATILDYEGLLQMGYYLLSHSKANDLTAIYIDVSLQERLKRSLNREGVMTDEQCLEVARRALADHQEVEIAKDFTDYVVKNEGDISIAYNRILDIIEGEK